jgi:hypothetical protein
VSVYSAQSATANNPDEVGKFERFLRTELPPLVRSELFRTLDSLPLSLELEEKVGGLLPEIIRDCQARLFQEYGKTTTAAESYQTPLNSVNLSSNPQFLDLATHKPADSLPDRELQSNMIPETIFALDGMDAQGTHLDSGFGTCGAGMSEDLNAWLENLGDEDDECLPGEEG